MMYAILANKLESEHSCGVFIHWLVGIFYPVVLLSLLFFLLFEFVLFLYYSFCSVYLYIEIYCSHGCMALIPLKTFIVRIKIAINKQNRGRTGTLNAEICAHHLLQQQIKHVCKSLEIRIYKSNFQSSQNKAIPINGPSNRCKRTQQRSTQNITAWPS